MPAHLLEEDFYKVSSLLNASKSVISFNRPAFISRHYNTANSFFLIAEGKKPNELSGSVSWGNSGFNFDIFFRKDATTGIWNVFYFINRHHVRGNTMVIAEDILEQGFALVSQSASNIIDNNVSDKRNRGYCIKRRINPEDKIIPTENTLKRLLELKDNNIVDENFYEFALLHAKKLTISFT